MTDDHSQQFQDLIHIVKSALPAEAMEYCQGKIGHGALDPYYLLVMGITSFCAGEAGLGIQLLERAHAIAPDCREVVDVLANFYTRLGRLADGLYYGKLAVCLQPRAEADGLVPTDFSSYMVALNNVGVSGHLANAEAAYLLGMHAEALAQAEKHLRIHPDDDGAMQMVARALIELQRPQAAAAMLRAALHHKPADPWLHGLLGRALTGCARHDAALEHLRLALAGAGDDDSLRNFVAGCLACQPDSAWPTAKALLDDYVATCTASRRRVPWRDELRSPVLGILSDQVYASPLASCVVPVLCQREMTVLYTLNPRHDQATEHFRTSVMRPRQAIGIDDATLGRIMSGDQLAALVNLCAPSESSRFPVFKGENAAPILHWVTDPMVDHIPGADYVLADEETAPVDRATYGEDRVVSISTLLAFEFPAILAAEEEVLDLPRATRGFPMFGVHGDPTRMTRESVSLWARVLWAVPEAHLLIGGRHDWEEEMVNWGLEAFAEFGVSNRVHFQAPVDGADWAANKAFPHMVDIILDSTPVNALAETVWDLWMGLPVVSLKGGRRAGRVGASVLRAVGRPEWAAEDEATYVAIAAALARAPGLGETRQNLRGQLLASRLADPVALGREISAAIDTLVAAKAARG